MFYMRDSNLEVSLIEANSHLLRESVCEDIKNQTRYDMCNANPLYLSENFNRFMKESMLDVVVYYPKWRWSKAMGYSQLANLIVFT